MGWVEVAAAAVSSAVKHDAVATLVRAVHTYVSYMLQHQRSLTMLCVQRNLGRNLANPIFAQTRRD